MVAAKAATNKGARQGGSATSGTVNWWGWTPTDTATANGYIAAFNKEYPDIKVNYKLVSIPDWQAALTPALRSDSGPDVFDMQPGSYVTKYGSFAQDMTPVITKALGDDWQSKVAPAGVSGLTEGRKADGPLRRRSSARSAGGGGGGGVQAIANCRARTLDARIEGKRSGTAGGHGLRARGG